MTIELTPTNALVNQAAGDAAYAEAQRLTSEANTLLYRAEGKHNEALNYWANARAIELALQSLEQNSEK